MSGEIEKVNLEELMNDCEEVISYLERPEEEQHDNEEFDKNITFLNDKTRKLLGITSVRLEQISNNRNNSYYRGLLDDKFERTNNLLRTIRTRLYFLKQNPNSYNEQKNILVGNYKNLLDSIISLDIFIENSKYNLEKYQNIDAKLDFLKKISYVTEFDDNNKVVLKSGYIDELKEVQEILNDDAWFKAMVHDKTGRGDCWIRHFSRQIINDSSNISLLAVEQPYKFDCISEVYRNDVSLMRKVAFQRGVNSEIIFFVGDDVLNDSTFIMDIITYSDDTEQSLQPFETIATNMLYVARHPEEGWRSIVLGPDVISDFIFWDLLNEKIERVNQNTHSNHKLFQTSMRKSLADAIIEAQRSLKDKGKSQPFLEKEKLSKELADAIIEVERSLKDKGKSQPFLEKEKLSKEMVEEKKAIAMKVIRKYLNNGYDTNASNIDYYDLFDMDKSKSNTEILKYVKENKYNTIFNYRLLSIPENYQLLYFKICYLYSIFVTNLKDNIVKHDIKTQENNDSQKEINHQQENYQLQSNTSNSQETKNNEENNLYQHQSTDLRNYASSQKDNNSTDSKFDINEMINSRFNDEYSLADEQTILLYYLHLHEYKSENIFQSFERMLSSDPKLNIYYEKLSNILLPELVYNSDDNDRYNDHYYGFESCFNFLYGVHRNTKIDYLTDKYEEYRYKFGDFRGLNRLEVQSLNDGDFMDLFNKTQNLLKKEDKLAEQDTCRILVHSMLIKQEKKLYDVLSKHIQLMEKCNYSKDEIRERLGNEIKHQMDPSETLYLMLYGLGNATYIISHNQDSTKYYMKKFDIIIDEYLKQKHLLELEPEYEKGRSK